CSHCHVTTTPLWRRDPSTQRPLCNACGLYLQQHKALRPQALIDDGAREDAKEEEGPSPQPQCSHCLTHQTSMWRKSKTGQQVCNACGIYERAKGEMRPLSLRGNEFKPRKK
ncbi:GATA zinc finger-domain-containing protein, partial [Roridomyces roridus]